ncbi:MAG: hypothetical protein IKB95_08265, partial [Bacteroidales bacterium]|nr:hypothetical protein [Bacteroidales bacterium]
PPATSRYPTTAYRYIHSPSEQPQTYDSVIETHKNENNRDRNITIANDLKFITFLCFIVFLLLYFYHCLILEILRFISSKNSESVIIVP